MNPRMPTSRKTAPTTMAAVGSQEGGPEIERWFAVVMRPGIRRWNVACAACGFLLGGYLVATIGHGRTTPHGPQAARQGHVRQGRGRHRPEGSRARRAAGARRTRARATDRRGADG